MCQLSSHGAPEKWSSDNRRAEKPIWRKGSARAFHEMSVTCPESWCRAGRGLGRGSTRLYGPPSHNGASYPSIYEFMMGRRTGPKGALAPKRRGTPVEEGTATLLRARGGGRHKERWLAMRARTVEKKRGIAAGTSGRQWVQPRAGIVIRSGKADTAENKRGAWVITGAVRPSSW